MSVLIVLMSGCAPVRCTEPSGLAGWPGELADLTMRWSAEPGISVTGRAAVVARAYVESYVLASAMRDDRYLYPGFDHAVDHNTGNGGISATEALWPDTEQVKYGPIVGTYHNRILTVDKSGSDLTMVVCTYLYATAMPGHSSFVTNWRAISDSDAHAGIYPLKITMTVPERSQLSLPPQEGWARTPSEDVFGDWRVTGFLWDYMGAGWFPREWPDYDQTLDTCAERAPDPLERRREIDNLTDPKRSDFPTLPAYPGWPEVRP
ncbi:hypothetical protein B8W67_15580 [Mycolicibacillus koreensis]|uniref:Uncharacterized protein n=2 Tax=Mycolicibacillus koreensis TaxID=1069220 RepID=A0AA91PCE4_9MYCO|nr:hypothetical protein B8W67_15580 [Mycolicibacillus koreensis]